MIGEILDFFKEELLEIYQTVKDRREYMGDYIQRQLDAKFDREVLLKR